MGPPTGEGVSFPQKHGHAWVGLVGRSIRLACLLEAVGLEEALDVKDAHDLAVLADERDLSPFREVPT